MKIYYIVATLIFSGLVSGCSSSKKSSALRSDPNYQAEFEGPLALTVADIQRLRSAQVDFLAPHEFQKAEASQRNVSDAFNSGRKSKDLREKIGEFKKLSMNAEGVAEERGRLLQPLIEARRNAIESGASSSNGFREADEQAKNLIGNMKDGARVDNQMISKFVIAYNRLEQEKVKDRSVGSISQVIEVAKREGAKKFAPESLKAIEQKRKNLENLIANDAQNLASIDELSASLKLEADRLVQITRQSKRFNEMDSEQIVLSFERMLSTIATSAGQPLLTDKALASQASELASQIALMKSENSSSSETSQQLTGDLAEAQYEVNRLEPLERLKEQEDKLEQIQRSFTKKEARVYRQANQLFISLRDVRFPAGKSEIRPENFEVLKKVQESLSNFKDSHITIAGHTDSTGSRRINQDLSEQRAEAVKQYLLSNSNIRENKISTVGYGFDQPIAANNTVEGRAANRRIDVIIETSTGDDNR